MAKINVADYWPFWKTQGKLRRFDYTAIDGSMPPLVVVFAYDKGTDSMLYIDYDAHLAPVDDDILREIAAMHFARIDGHSDNWDRYVDEAKDYIDAIRPHIEAVERERCAKIADKYEGEWHSDTAEDACARAIATAIRSGK